MPAQKVDRIQAFPRIVALFLMLLPADALAHAQLRSAKPGDRAVVVEAPAEVVLTFSEPVAPLSALWTSPDGLTMPTEVRADGARLIITVPPAALRGTQVVSWRVVSEDGHPVAGAHVFSIGIETAVAPPPAERASARLAAMARALLTALLGIGVGGLAFSRLMRSPEPVIVRPAALAVIPAGLLLLAAQAADLGGGAATLAQPATWGMLARSPFVAAVGLSAAALAMALFRSRWLALVALAIAGTSFAVAGHAGTAAPWSAPVVAVHATMAVFWAGALAVLATPSGQAAALVPFGRIAPALVAFLVAGGGALAWVQLEPCEHGWDVLLATAYGRVLTAKLVLAAMIIALAALNRWRLAPAALTGRGGGLARSIRFELLLMIVLLSLTGAFRLIPPPRAMVAEAVNVHVHGRLSAADVRFLPGRPGANRLEIIPFGADFGPLVPAEIAAELTLPAAGLGPIRVEARPVEDGLWAADGLILPAAGAWDVVVTILIDDFTQDRFGTTVVIAGDGN